MDDKDGPFILNEERNLYHPITLATSNHHELTALAANAVGPRFSADHGFNLADHAAMPGGVLFVPFDPPKSVDCHTPYFIKESA